MKKKIEIAIIVIVLIVGTLSVFCFATTLQRTQLWPSTVRLQPSDEITDPHIKEQFTNVKQWADRIQQVLDETFRKTSLNLTSPFTKDIITKSPWVDVRAYGATGDGETDDTTALQAAIDAATTYGMVVLPPGTYKFSQLKFYNPIVFTGLGSISGRWNNTEAAVKLLHDESVNPAIIIGGTTDSFINAGGYYSAEGITLANFLLYPAGTTANVGILLDGSTTILGTRGSTRDIKFENVIVRDFGSNNIKFLGNVFDVRFKGGGSFARYADGILTESATSIGSNSGGQRHFYDFYSTAATGDWNFNGSAIRLYGGGVAYGNGFLAGSQCQIYGTAFEGWGADPASIGLKIVGQYGIFNLSTIYNYDTAIIIGDGTADVARRYNINTTITGATTGVQITDGGTRTGVGRITFDSDVTTEIVDDRADNDGVYNDFIFLNSRRSVKVIRTLADEATPTVGATATAQAGIFLTGGTTQITDFDDGYPGQIITVVAEHVVVITDGTNIFTPTGGNLTLQITDTLTLVQKADGKWYTLFYSDNT